MARLSKETKERMDEVLSIKVKQANEKGLLDINRLVKGRYVTADIEVNYLIDNWHMVEKAVEMQEPGRMIKYILTQRKKINGLFSKDTKETQ